MKNISSIPRSIVTILNVLFRKFGRKKSFQSGTMSKLKGEYA